MSDKPVVHYALYDSAVFSFPFVGFCSFSSWPFAGSDAYAYRRRRSRRRMYHVSTEIVPHDMRIHAMMTAILRPRCEFVLNMIVRSAWDLIERNVSVRGWLSAPGTYGALTGSWNECCQHGLERGDTELDAPYRESAAVYIDWALELIGQHHGRNIVQYLKQR